MRYSTTLIAIHFFVCTYAQICIEKKAIEITNTNNVISCVNQLDENGCMQLNATYTDVKSATKYELSTIPFTPVVNFNTGNRVSITKDDKWSSIIPLPFSFCFYGNTFNSIVVGDNGLMSFKTDLSGNDCAYFSASLPNKSLYTNTIFGAYHDLTNDDNVFGCNDNPNTPENECGEIKTTVIGAYPCRAFVINFYNLNHFDCENSRSTSQIVLYEFTNIIEIYVKNKPINCEIVDFNNAYRKNALIGIQNSDGTDALFPLDRNSGVWEATNEAYRFTPSGTSLATVSWKDSNGSIIGNGTSVTICPTANSEYTAEVSYGHCVDPNLVFSDKINITYDLSFPLVKDLVAGICDSLPFGSEIVDLTSFQSQLIATSSGFSLKYYPTLLDAENKTNEIVSITNINLTKKTTTFYVRAESSSLCYDIGTLTLILAEKPSSKLAKIVICDWGVDGTENVVLTNYSNQIIGNQLGLIVKYFSSEQAANSNTNPITTLNAANGSSVWLRLSYNDSCFSVVQIPIELKSIPSIVSVPITICSNIAINLNNYISQITSNNASLITSFYKTENDAKNKTNPILNVTNYIPFPAAKIFVRVENPNGCYSVSTIDISYNIAPETNNSELHACDTDSDLKEIFDLTTALSSMNYSNVLSYQFYNSYNGALNKDTNDVILNPTNLVVDVPGKVVYVLFTDPLTGCFRINTLALKILEFPKITTQNFNICDTKNDGTEKIHLANYNNQIIGNFSATMNVKYYLTLNDANNNTNEIYDIEVPNVSSVWITAGHIINGELFCLNTLPEEIKFNLEKTVSQKMSVSICDNNNEGIEKIDLTKYENQISSTGTNFTYYINGNQIGDPKNFNITATTNVILVKYQNGSICLNDTEITFTLIPSLSIVQNLKIEKCDSDGNGSEAIDLTTILNSITPNFSDYTISYYTNQNSANAGLATNLISNPTTFNNIVGILTVYIRFVNPTTQCFSVNPVQLQTYALPVFKNNIFSICDFNNDGIEVNYDVSVLNNQILGNQTGIVISYYTNLLDAQNKQNSINFYNVINNSKIFVRLERPQNCITIEEITLNLVSAEFVTSPIITLCDNLNDNKETVNLTSYESQLISNPTNWNFTYFTSLSNAKSNINTITNPNAQNVTLNSLKYYVRITNSSNCITITELTFKFHQKINSKETELAKCDADVNLSETFDLNQAIPIMIDDATLYDISFYKNFEAAFNSDTNFKILNTTNYVVNGDLFIVYVKFINKNTGCFDIKELTLRVVTLPKFVNTKTFVCDDNLDGTFEHNLTLLNSLVIEDTTNITFTYFTSINDANNNTNPITNFTSYLIPTFPFDIYIKGVNQYGCGNISKVTLLPNIKTEVSNVAIGYSACDELSDGVEFFNLTLFEPNLTNEVNAIFEYYTSYQDAANQTNKIQDPTKFLGKTQTIYVRIYTDVRCSNIGEISLTLLDLPITTLQANISVCFGKKTILDAGPGLETYLWSTGDTTQTIEVGEGEYWVELFNGNCTKRFPVKVSNLPNPIAEIEYLEYNNIRVISKSTNKLLYSIDNVNFQESEYFNNLDYGIQTMYLQDAVTGCTNQFEFLIIKINNVITPNDDGKNDQWCITYLDKFAGPTHAVIYDRYGKAIYEQTSNTEICWDGKYLGRHLPSTSYWYTVTLFDGRKFNGYVMLKNYLFNNGLK